jgi:hypothetical protein
MRDVTRQIAGVYHRKIGDVLVTGLSDGYVDMGYSIFRNIPEQETKAILGAITASRRRGSRSTRSLCA